MKLVAKFSISLLTFGMILFTSANAQERFVLPIDEAKKDPSFFSFREKLISATRARDQKYIFSVVAGDIKNSFGGNDGFEEFKKAWNFDKKDSPFWDEFLTVITNGGAFYKEKEVAGTFCAPYPFMNFPDDIDAFEHMMIFGKNVNLRSEPNLFAPILAKLSYNVIKVDFNKSSDDGKTENNFIWLKVTTLGGKTGFVSGKYVRSAIAYRACFANEKGKWKMTAFIAGD